MGEAIAQDGDDHRVPLRKWAELILPELDGFPLEQSHGEMLKNAFD